MHGLGIWNVEFLPIFIVFCVMLERFGVGCRLKVVWVCTVDDSSDLPLEIVISQYSLHVFIGSVDRCYIMMFKFLNSQSNPKLFFWLNLYNSSRFNTILIEKFLILAMYWQNWHLNKCHLFWSPKI